MNQREWKRSTPSLRLGFFAIAGLVMVLASACSSTEKAKVDDVGTSGYWLKPSPILGQQIEDEAARLPWSHGVEKLELIRWFASVGEPAYPTLLRLTTDSRDHVAAAALAALGATGDRRLVQPLHVIPWPEERYRGDLGYERARTLLRLGDWSEIPTLISGLRNERIYTRSLCIQALKQATGDDLRYNPSGDEQSRENGARRWEDWWLARTGEGVLR